MYHKHFNQNTEMKRKDYRKPTMKIVKLHYQSHLLQASATRRNYGKANSDVDPKQLDNDGNWKWD